MNFARCRAGAYRVNGTGGRKKVIQMTYKHTRDNENRTNRKTPKAKTGNVRYSYFDCLRDEVPVPKGANGSTLYQLLMAGCMVLFVFSANGALDSGASFFAYSH